MAREHDLAYIYSDKCDKLIMQKLEEKKNAGTFKTLLRQFLFRSIWIGWHLQRLEEPRETALQFKQQNPNSASW